VGPHGRSRRDSLASSWAGSLKAGGTRVRLHGGERVPALPPPEAGRPGGPLLHGGEPTRAGGRRREGTGQRAARHEPDGEGQRPRVRRRRPT
jgi:hypothetical protein